MLPTNWVGGIFQSDVVPAGNPVSPLPKVDPIQGKVGRALEVFMSRNMRANR
jgi:hypothetical protein